MKTIWVVIFLFLFTRCSHEIRVYSDHDPAYKLSDYASFNWAVSKGIETNENPLYYNELNDKRIKGAVQEQMASRGYVLTEEKPELTLHYHIVVEDESVISTEPYGYYYGSYWLNTRTNVYPYKEGTLILDLMEAKSNGLVWRGWAVAPIDFQYNSEQLDHLIKTAIEKIFKEFPATAKPSDAGEQVIIN